ncbi:putative LysM domain-containing protein [Rosa chinensis]|uniref:Putative LysM domain-containing protein n=1 Tax=Rosa chinensis TaxID=74649 RepID=A0A2P6PT64_ROSCH|nr:lysM domain-containing GPI-anchored protein 2 [Rosa chinensis]PRQ25125.1 putative LysM domain-containing protein [Rosa chinensis]
MSFSNLTLLLTLALLISTLTAPSSAATFNCTTPSANSTCQSLIDFAPINATTLNAVKTLFNITHLRTLLGANNLPLSTRPNEPVTANQKLRIPFSCRCSNGSGVSYHRPQYIVKAGDGLDYIATSLFSRLVTYQEIARVNGIPDPNKIEVGQKLWIPLPCSCDKVDGEEVVHYGHVVDPGSTVQGIAEEYGTTQETLLRINGMPDPNELEAGQVLDVPLKACASSVRDDSIDSPLLVPNNTYVFTAFNCVKCQCSSANNWKLQCEPSNLNSKCPSMQCQDSNQLYIGNTTSSSSCNQTTCAYRGYDNQTIFTDLVAQSTCSTPSIASKMGLHSWSWNFLFVSIHLALLCLHLL